MVRAMNLLIWTALGAFLPLGNLSLFASRSLNVEQSSVVAGWLSKHPEYRLANDKDCECDEDIRTMRNGSGGVWKPIPGYHPPVACGDFNGDGVIDFAVVVINRCIAHDFVLLVF